MAIYDAIGWMVELDGEETAVFLKNLPKYGRLKQSISQQ